MNARPSLQRLRPDVLLAIGLCAALLWAYPLITLKLGQQGDIAVHLRWVEQFYSALQDGVLLPRWAHAAQLGLGDPSFFYYQPLFYYVTSLFRWMGFGPERALLLAGAMPTFAVAGIAYVQFLKHYPARGALAGTVFVACTPALFFMSTHLAGFPWTLSIPFSLLFAIESIRDKPRARYIAVLLCLICLSHLLSGMMTLLATGLARLVFAAPKRHNLAANAAWLGGVVLGLALAAFFLYPALSQMHLINPAGWKDDFVAWERCFALPVVTSIVFGIHWFGVQWVFASLCLGIILVVLLPRSQLPRTAGEVSARRLGFVALCALLLGTDLAYPLYALLPPMEKLQFPYRFVFLASVLASVALAIRLNEGAWKHWGKLTRGAVLLLILAHCGQIAILQAKIARDGLRMAAHEKYFSGRFGQPEYLLAVRGPLWKEYAAAGGLAHDCSRLEIACSNIVKRSHSFKVDIDTPRAVTVRLPIFAFPAWEATVNGQPQSVVIDRDTGLVALQLAPGRHQIALRFGRLPVEIAGLWVSAVAALVLACLFVLGRYRLDPVRKASVAVNRAPVATS